MKKQSVYGFDVKQSRRTKSSWTCRTGAVGTAVEIGFDKGNWAPTHASAGRGFERQRALPCTYPLKKGRHPMPDPELTYFIKCIVEANFSDTAAVTNVSVIHTWSPEGYQPGYTDTGTTASFRVGDTFEFSIHVGPGGTPDKWSIEFTDRYGSVWQRTDKWCNVEQEDIDSHEPVIVSLLGFPTDRAFSFSIITPVSSPCLNNEISPQ
jgi:hypothetical protein